MSEPTMDAWERRVIPSVDHLHNRNATFELGMTDAFVLRRMLLRVVDHPDLDPNTRLLYKRVIAGIEMGVQHRATPADSAVPNQGTP